MIRTLFTFVFAAVGVVIIMPPLMVWTMISGDVQLMYDVFISAVRVALRIAGIRVRAEGVENIPAGTCVFASNHCSNLDPLAMVPKIPRKRMSSKFRYCQKRFGKAG
jgi:1-acyl-sn-glycerol-3-phosphate acyltransferase